MFRLEQNLNKIAKSFLNFSSRFYKEHFHVLFYKILFKLKKPGSPEEFFLTFF